MPECLNIECSSRGHEGLKYLLYKIAPIVYNQFKSYYDSVNKYDKEEKENVLSLGGQYLSNIGKYGCSTWNEWRKQNWGTKWNAYDIEIEGCVILFNTAWCGVPELIGVLSTFFPDILFEYSYADEDAGYNTGFGQIKNGCVDMNYPEGGSGESWDVYFDTHPDYKEYYKLVDGEWEYIDD